MAFDVAFGIVLVLGALRGHRLGFAKQMIHLIGLVVAIVLADPVARLLVPVLAGQLESAPRSVHVPILYVGSLVGIWLVVVIAGSVYLKMYRQHVFGRDVPSPGDRYFGAGLGALKSAVIVCIAVFLLNRLPAGVREKEPICRHYRSSKAIRGANAVDLVGQLVKTRELRRAQAHLGELVEYYRSSEEDSGRAEQDGTLRR